MRLRPFKGDELIVFFRLLCGRSFRPFLRLIRLFRYLLILKADNLKVLNNDLCLAITAGSVEQDIDLLAEFDQFKRIRCFPDPPGIRILIQHERCDSVRNERMRQLPQVAFRWCRYGGRKQRLRFYRVNTITG